MLNTMTDLDAMIIEAEARVREAKTDYAITKTGARANGKNLPQARRAFQVAREELAALRTQTA